MKILNGKDYLPYPESFNDYLNYSLPTNDFVSKTITKYWIEKRLNKKAFELLNGNYISVIIAIFHSIRFNF